MIRRLFMQRFCTSAFALEALSPLDGRYARSTGLLKPYFSESALMKYRLRVQTQWLLHLIREKVILLPEPTLLPALSQHFDQIFSSFDSKAAQRIKAIQGTTNHDLKSIEYFLKQQLNSTKFEALQEYIHILCTSEDINNLSYALMLRDAMKEVILPQLHLLNSHLITNSHQWSHIAMLARTHGQPATPTTLGKQFANYSYRLSNQMIHISSSAKSIKGKFNGAVGNYNAHLFTYPTFDWIGISQRFVSNLGLVFNPYSTQIECHDSISRLFNEVSLANTILIGLCRDSWEYISKNYLKQATKSGEIGSSTMPHKVNPIDFQNAEGNLGLANSILNHLSTKLPISRQQRDLSDSTVLRSQGVGLGHSLLAYKNLLQGLGKIAPNEQVIAHDLENHHEVITEAIQSELRRINYPKPYELLKELSRGKNFNRDTVLQLISKLRGKVPAETIQKLELLTPANYLGYAEKLAKDLSK